MRTNDPGAVADANTLAPKEQAKRIPGEAEFWLFIIGDLLVFTVLFLFYVFQRRKNLEQFHIDQALLSQNIGLLNTLILLTSSLFVAIACFHTSPKRIVGTSIKIARERFCG